MNNPAEDEWESNLLEITVRESAEDKLQTHLLKIPLMLRFLAHSAENSNLNKGISTSSKR